MGYLHMTLLQISNESSSERILKIGQYLVKLWARVRCLVFLTHSVFVVMHTIICIFEFMNFALFRINFVTFKPIIKFKKFELHYYGKSHLVRSVYRE